MDTELVVRAQDGDREAFAELADASLDRFLAVAQGILGDTRLAEDATQQALLSIWQNLPSLRHPERFGAWPTAWSSMPATRKCGIHVAGCPP